MERGENTRLMRIRYWQRKAVEAGPVRETYVPGKWSPVNSLKLKQCLLKRTENREHPMIFINIKIQNANILNKKLKYDYKI